MLRMPFCGSVKPLFFLFYTALLFPAGPSYFAILTYEQADVRIFAKYIRKIPLRMLPDMVKIRPFFLYTENCSEKSNVYPLFNFSRMVYNIRRNPTQCGKVVST